MIDIRQTLLLLLQISIFEFLNLFMVSTGAYSQARSSISCASITSFLQCFHGILWSLLRFLCWEATFMIKVFKFQIFSEVRFWTWSLGDALLSQGSPTSEFIFFFSVPEPKAFRKVIPLKLLNMWVYFLATRIKYMLYTSDTSTYQSICMNTKSQKAAKSTVFLHIGEFAHYYLNGFDTFTALNHILWVYFLTTSIINQDWEFKWNLYVWSNCHGSKMLYNIEL